MKPNYKVLRRSKAKQDPAHKKFLKLLFGLPLLQPKDIPQASEQIYAESVRTFMQDVHVREGEEVQDDEHEGEEPNECCLFFYEEYFEPYWLSTIGPENFTVFAEMDRTNNRQESYHRDLANVMGSRPVLRVFLRE